MLPLISNGLPATVPTQAASTAIALGSGVSDASAATRQYLSTAVSAAAAPAAFFAGNPQGARQLAVNDRANTTRVNVPPPTGDYIEVPNPPPAPQQARTNGPVTLGIPLTTQLTAQLMAQQPKPAISSAELPPPMRETNGPSKPRSGQSFGFAKGADAYQIAATRAASLPPLPDPVEAADAI